jgi:deoxyadenosine/deoxycytidine kinase
MKCQYRNCNVEIDSQFKNQIYCSRLHKEYEKKYRKRSLEPKKKIGRPKHSWKTINEITMEDVENLISKFLYIEKRQTP